MIFQDWSWKLFVTELKENRLITFCFGFPAGICGRIYCKPNTGGQKIQ
jgi:hypothetical protein